MMAGRRTVSEGGVKHEQKRPYWPKMGRPATRGRRGGAGEGKDDFLRDRLSRYQPGEVASRKAWSKEYPAWTRKIKH